MTNKQADTLIGQRITVRHKISHDEWTICLKGRWTGTVYYVTDNVFGVEQTTAKPVFNIYPVELVNVAN